MRNIVIISVKDRLPNDCMPVIAYEFDNHGGDTSFNYGVAKCYYSYASKKWVLDKEIYEVYGDAIITLGFKPTHWQPLFKLEDVE